MFGIPQEFVAQIWSSGMESPWVYRKVKKSMCMETYWKLRAMMAMLSKVIVVTLCFGVQVMEDGIQQCQSAFQVGKSWWNTLTWRLLISECTGLGHSVQLQLSADVHREIYVQP